MSDLIGHDRPPTRDDIFLEEGELRETSDRLLQMLPALRALEERKRVLLIGSTEFVAIADQVEELARRFAAWAILEQQLAREAAASRDLGTLPALSIDEVEARPVQRVLADWREATIRFDETEPDTPDHAEAAADMARYRREYHQLADRALEQHRG